MSNKLILTYTKFYDLDSKGNEIESAYGYRLFDDYAQVYCNRFSSMEELLTEVNEENFWEALRHWDEFEDVDPMETGMFFNDTWYDGDEIKEIAEAVAEKTAKRITD